MDIHVCALYTPAAQVGPHGKDIKVVSVIYYSCICVHIYAIPDHSVFCRLKINHLVELHFLRFIFGAGVVKNSSSRSHRMAISVAILPCL